MKNKMKQIIILMILMMVPTIGNTIEITHINDTTIKLEGTINKGDYKLVRSNLKNIDTVILGDSKGGNLHQGILIGKFLMNGKNIVVDGECDSSCSLIGIGGDYTFTDNGSFGVHGVSVEGKLQTEGHHYEMFVNYIKSKGNPLNFLDHINTLKITKLK